MNAEYEVVGNIVVKKYENDDSENLCLLEDLDIVINRTRETLNRVENRLKLITNTTEESALSIMLQDYANELNELKKIQLLNK